MQCSINDLKCWLKISIINCCAALLEGVTDTKLPQIMLEFLDLRNIEHQLLETSRLLGFLPAETNPVPGKRFSVGYEHSLQTEMFGFYHLMLNLAEWDTQGTVAENLRGLEVEYPSIMAHLKRFTTDVEIVRPSSNVPGGKLVEKVYFSVDPKVLELINTRDFRVEAMQTMFDVPRDNPQEKARAFLEKLKLVSKRVQLYTFLLDNPIRRFLIQGRCFFADTPRLLAMLITLLLLLTYGIPVDPNTGKVLGQGRFFSYEEEPPSGYNDEPYEFANLTSDPSGSGASYSTIMQHTDLSLKHRLLLKNRWQSEAEWEMFPAARWILAFLGFVHVVLVLINSAFYLVQDFPLVISKVVDAHFDSLRAENKVEAEKHGAWQKIIIEEGMETILQDIRIGGNKRAKAVERIPPFPRRTALRNRRQLIRSLFRACGDAAYWAIMCTLSLLGFISSPFFFVFYMLDYFRTQDGKLVLQAIIIGGPNLFKSFTAGVLVIICFGFYSYAYFSSTINDEQELCHSPFQCVVKHVLDSLTDDMGTVLGDDFGNYAYPAVVFWADSWKAWQNTFVLAGIVFWVFLLQGIIQGQIIDAFAENRARVEKAKEDLNNKCFVTSIDRFVFASYPGEWDKRKDGQYAWRYLLFLSYLQDKDPEEYTGLENFVMGEVKAGSVSFLPIEMFAAQQRELFNEGKTEVETAMENLTERVGKLELGVDKASANSDKILTVVQRNRKALTFTQRSMPGGSGTTLGPYRQSSLAQMASFNFGRTGSDSVSGAQPELVSTDSRSSGTDSRGTDYPSAASGHAASATLRGPQLSEPESGAVAPQRASPITPRTPPPEDDDEVNV
mmetsp:Transcript_36720/g.57378  ORF Transcript_36720/g.57378 Transcript_36720/m.57378 type:complete len:838 (-) Transcript_36720:1502-4015(-)